MAEATPRWTSTYLPQEIGFFFVGNYPLHISQPLCFWKFGEARSRLIRELQNAKRHPLHSWATWARLLVPCVRLIVVCPLHVTMMESWKHAKTSQHINLHASVHTLIAQNLFCGFGLNRWRETQGYAKFAYFRELSYNFNNARATVCYLITWTIMFTDSRLRYNHYERGRPFTYSINVFVPLTEHRRGGHAIWIRGASYMVLSYGDAHMWLLFNTVGLELFLPVETTIFNFTILNDKQTSLQR